MKLKGAIGSDRASAVEMKRGDPLVTVDWHALFFNYLIDTDVLRGQIPPCFELDLRDGKAGMSLVALSMRNFRRHPNAPWYASAFTFLRQQDFLNLRAYVRFRGEPGVFFLWGWLSRPAGLPLPDEPLGLTCSCADINYSHAPTNGLISGSVRAHDRSFTHTSILDGNQFAPCPAGSLTDFIMERYTGFYWHNGIPRTFRAAHEPWQSVELEPRISDLSLVTTPFPWFAAAGLAEARLCAKCPNVSLGRPHRLPVQHPRPPHRAAAFFEMP